MLIIITIVIPMLWIQQCMGLISDEISFLVLSQTNKYHSGIAEHLKHAIIEQSAGLDDGSTPNVYLSHEVFHKSTTQSWAITPILIDILTQLIKPKTKWFVVCEANSVVNMTPLLMDLEQEDYRTEMYLGSPLFDRDATIIHHFAFFRNPSEFHYPYLRAGVAFTIPLLNRLVDHMQLAKVPPKAPTDFSIDAAHELALFIWNVDQSLKLKSVPYFCKSYGPNCSIYARHETIYCGNPISLDKVLFAVKTCEKYHNERLPVILRSWAQFTIHLRIFSDVHHGDIPTIATGIENTERGHCEKTLTILRMLLNEIMKNSTLKNVDWIVMADDDTLLSPSALSEYLGCFDKNQFIYLGERYGYDLFADESGYNYITGGGGIVFNLKTLRKLVESCSCPSPSSPDDMIIGACLRQQHIEAIHSSLFHQARPKDYPTDVLERNSISFHKFWQIDPLEVYAKWFRKRDEDYFCIHKHLLAEHKYLKRKCIENTDENFDKNKNQKPIGHVEL